ACRADNPARFSFGDNDSVLGNYAWFRTNSRERTQVVGSKEPNDWGLYDMHGNVWEWCLDWYADRLPGGRVTDPPGPSAGTDRVIRGGSFDSGWRFLRSADRGRPAPGYQTILRGFRVVISDQP
ncbi:MAG: formylglycine-generating enzyme family protein, partial [Candidatus Sumerlaeia bacterium]|nr:formylglycine-generating enzyme family protein [Candidatus Sumerlaeia bacterium]